MTLANIFCKFNLRNTQLFFFFYCPSIATEFYARQIRWTSASFHSFSTFSVVNLFPSEPIANNDNVRAEWLRWMKSIRSVLEIEGRDRVSIRRIKCVGRWTTRLLYFSRQSAGVSQPAAHLPPRSQKRDRIARVPEEKVSVIFQGLFRRPARYPQMCIPFTSVCHVHRPRLRAFCISLIRLLPERREPGEEVSVRGFTSTCRRMKNSRNSATTLLNFGKVLRYSLYKCAQ